MAVEAWEAAAMTVAVMGLIASVTIPVVAWACDKVRDIRRRRHPIDWSPDWNLKVGDDGFEETLSNERERRNWYARKAQS